MNNTTAYDTVKQFFDYYLTERNIDKVLSIVSDDIYSLGTGEDEIAIGKDEFAKLLQHEIKTLPTPIKYEIKNYHDKSKIDGCFDCFCNMKLIMKISNGSEIHYSTRFTGCVCNENGKMLLQSAHMSEASSYQEEGEFFPLKFASEKTKYLDKDAKHNLWEIFCQMLPGGIIGGYIEDGFPLYMVNEYLLKMAGYSSYDEFVKDTNGLVINSMYEDDRQMVVDVVAKALAKSNQYEVQYRMKTKDGGYIWVYDIGRKTVAQDGRDAIISMLVDVSDQVKTTQYLIDESTKDSLTGIYNRKGAENRIAEALNNSSEKYVFMMVDLDNFKMLNDVYGHAEGDKALCFIADKLNSSFRKTDTVCRIGGDEFALFISDCLDIAPIEEKIRGVIKEYAEMIKQNYPESNSSVSFGGICTSGVKTFTELYKKADSVLYEIKKSNKGTYAIKNM